MFYTLILFVVSLIAEVLLLNFLSPLNSDETINFVNTILFSLNTGVLIGSIYALILFLIYWLIKAYDEIIYKNFYRRAFFVGVSVALTLFLKLIGSLDYLIVLGLVIIIICLEIILSKRD